MAADQGPGEEDPGAKDLSYEEKFRALPPLFRPLSDAEIAKRQQISQGAGKLTPEILAFALWELDSPGVLGWDDKRWL